MVKFPEDHLTPMYAALLLINQDLQSDSTEMISTSHMIINQNVILLEKL